MISDFRVSNLESKLMIKLELRGVNEKVRFCCVKDYILRDISHHMQ